MIWTFNSTGGDLMGDNGETFALIFRGSPLFPFIHESELARMRIHRKRCPEVQGCAEFGAIGRQGKTVNDTSLIKSETVVCAAPGTSS